MALFPPKKPVCMRGWVAQAPAVLLRVKRPQHRLPSLPCGGDDSDLPHR